jgi:hypothetical protein
MSENVGASTSRNPKGLHGLHRDNFTLPYPERILGWLYVRATAYPYLPYTIIIVTCSGVRVTKVTDLGRMIGFIGTSVTSFLNGIQL